VNITKTAVITLILCILFYCLDYYFRISPSLVIPQLMQQYHISPLGIGSFASAFYVGYVLLQLPCGMMLDRYPLHMVLALAMTLCTLCFAAFVLTDIFWWGMLLRWLIGAASALSFISVLFIARHYLPLNYFAFISGITIAAGTFAASLAATVTAIGMNYFSWKIVFSLTAALGIIIALFIGLAGRKLPRPKLQPLVAWTDLRQTFWQLIRNRLLFLNALVGGLFYLPTSIFAAVWGISFLQLQDGLSRTQASTGVTFLFAGWALGSPLIGLLSERLRDQRYLLSGAATGAMAVSLFLLYGTPIHFAAVCLTLGIFGLFSSAQTVVWKIFHDHCPRALSGTGIAVTNMLIMLTVSIAHPFIGWLLTNPNAAEQLTLRSLHKGLCLIPIAFAVSAALGYFLNKKI
jgi:MFS family permease